DPGQIHLVVLTGAGISADSGVRTFRDSGGLWEGHDVMQVATPAGWRADPALVWRFYQKRRAQLKEVEPNSAHQALFAMECTMNEMHQAFTLISQNVDDLHQRCGSSVLDMHGQLSRLLCERCGMHIDERETCDPEQFIACPNCRFERMRPDVVWFGEMPHHMEEIEFAMRDCTHFLSIGTSGSVYPAAGLLAAARERGAQTTVNSLDEPENLEPADEFHAGRASEVIPALLEAWREGWFA
ncbi:MAG: NAD-dependent deacetylase, partial [Planctomycetota bacterium]